MSSPKRRAVLFLLLANMFWAGNLVVGRYVVDAVHPISLTFLRWSVVALALLPFQFTDVATTHALFSRRNLPLILALSLTGAGLYQSMVYVGLSTTTAINASLINATTPAVIVLMSALMGAERTSRSQALGILISLLGIVFVVTRGDIRSISSLRWNSGDAFMILSLPLWALYSVLLKRTPAAIKGTQLLFAVAALGTLCLIPAVVVETWFLGLPSINARAALSIVYLGLCPSLAAYILWNDAIYLVGSNVAGLSMSIIPFLVVLFAVPLLHEPFHTYHAVGLAVTLLGIVLSLSGRTSHLSHKTLQDFAHSRLTIRRRTHEKKGR